MTDEEKKSTINGFVELTAKYTLTIFRGLGLNTHIEATVVDDTTGDQFMFRFIKLNSDWKNKTDDLAQGVIKLSKENSELLDKVRRMKEEKAGLTEIIERLHKDYNEHLASLKEENQRLTAIITERISTVKPEQTEEPKAETIAFAKWYSGMEYEKVKNAYKRYQREVLKVGEVEQPGSKINKCPYPDSL